MPTLQPSITKQGNGADFYLRSGNLPSQVLEYSLPSGTNGGAALGGGVFYAREMNTGYPALDVNGNSSAIPGLSLNILVDGTQITFPAGTYSIQALVCGLMLTQQARLFDVTNNQVIATGLSVGAETRNNVAPVYAEVTFLTPTVVEIQFCGDQAFGNQDYGQACSFAGSSEVYLQVIITKEA